MKVIDLGSAEIALAIVNHYVRTTYGVWVGKRVGAEHADLKEIVGISPSKRRGSARYT